MPAARQLLDAVAAFRPRATNEALALPEKKLLLARGHAAPEVFETATTHPELEATWKSVEAELSEEELLGLYGEGGAPGAEVQVVISSRDLADLGEERVIYTERSNYPEDGLFLLASSRATPDADANFLEELLATSGTRFGTELFVLADEVRSSFSTPTLVPWFVKALEHQDFDRGDLLRTYLGSDERYWDEEDWRTADQLERLPSHERLERLVTSFLPAQAPRSAARGRGLPRHGHSNRR